MPLFEVEDGRLVPAQFGRSVDGAMTPEVLEVVRAQVLEIVRRPLFPVTWRDVAHPTDGSARLPRLTALDSAGQVVSVEVLDHLDSDTLISSLSRLADTASLSWTDLAHEYPGGVAAFKDGWLRFRESMSASSGSGPRLVMVVGSIDAQVRPALEVLAASGVEVHLMSLREMANGRMFLEVHAVGARLYGHVPAVLSGSEAVAALPRVPSDEDGDAASLAPTGPASTPMPSRGPRPTPAPQGRDEAGDPEVPVSRPRPEADTALTAPMPSGRARPSTRTPDEARVDVTGTRAESSPGAARPDEHPEVGVMRPPLPPRRSRHGRRRGAHGVPSAPTAEGLAPRVVAPRHARPVPPEAVDAPAPAAAPVSSDRSAPVVGETPLFPPSARVRRTAEAVEAATHSRVDSMKDEAELVARAREAGVPVLDTDAAGLEVVARVAGGDTPLALPASLDLTTRGHLTAAGLIEVDGCTYDDPTEALADQGHIGLDGWEQWRLNDAAGPTLAEALLEVNVAIVREHARPARARRH